MLPIRSMSLVLAALLASTALSGCFTGGGPESDDGAPANSISRSYSVVLDKAAMETLEDTEDPAADIKKLVDTSLVVRVAEAGDYTLKYTTVTGAAREETLAGMQPGVARTIGGVDPLAPATLLSGSTVLAERKVKDFDGFHVGDVPLGFYMADGASAEYSYTGDARSQFELHDVTSEEGSLDSLEARLNLPIRGSVAWTMVEDGSDSRLDLDSRFRIPEPSDGSILTFEASGREGDKPGSLGVEVPALRGKLEGALSLWFRDGQLVAGQGKGTLAELDPTVYVWSTGEGTEDIASSCAGKAREDRCQPEDVEKLEESSEATPKEDIDADEFEADEAGARGAIRFLEDLFGQDVHVGDQLLVRGEMTDEMAGEEKSDFRVTFSYELVAPAKESLTVPAGTFDALKITQTTKFTAHVTELVESSWDYEAQESVDKTVVRDLTLDETVSRTTLWLDSASWTPLKVVIESPMDVGVLVDRILDATTDAAWEDMGTRLTSDKIQWTLTGVTTMEATKLTGTMRFTPYLGLMLAGASGGGAGMMGLPMFGIWGRGFGGGYDEAVPVTPVAPPYGYETPYPTPTPAYPTQERTYKSMSLTSAGPLSGGNKSYTVAGASSDMGWYDLLLRVEGSEFPHTYFDETCPAPEPGTFAVCMGDVAKGSWDLVEAGDTVTLAGVEAGQTLLVIDREANAVLLSLRIV